MIKTLKALSALLSYPTRELQEAIWEISDCLEGKPGLSEASQQALMPLFHELATNDIYDLEEQYVSLFDRSRTLSLNLFEHVHGESRDRGGAMVDLLETYRAQGLEPTGPELPDHLPILLEFLSTLPIEEAREILQDAAHILEALRVRLDRRGTPYAAVFVALLDFAAAAPNAEATAELTDIDDDDPHDLEALDAVWEEAAVTFGPDPNAGCPATRDMLTRMSMPDPGEPADPKSIH